MPAWALNPVSYLIAGVILSLIVGILDQEQSLFKRSLNPNLRGVHNKF